MSEEDFFNKLVNETFTHHDESISFIETKIKSLEVPYFKGHLLSSFSIVRFHSLWGILDFPASLNVFTFDGNFCFHLSQNNDSDFIFSVFSKVWEKDLVEILFICFEGEYFMLGLKDQDKEKMRFIEKFFLKNDILKVA